MWIEEFFIGSNFCGYIFNSSKGKDKLVKAANFFLMFVFSFGSLAGVVYANSELPAIVVTGSRIPVQANSDEVNVFVVDREEIDRQNPGSVAQLLQGISGVYVENNGAKGNVSAVYLRGAEPNYTLVLIDGVAVNDPSNSRGGAFDFSLLDINSIERIEVVKGPASFVYGSVAMAGVINIITRKIKQAQSVSFETEAGSRGLLRISALSGFIKDRGEISLNASYEDVGEQVKGSKYKASSFAFTGALDVSKVTEISLTTRYHESEASAFPDASGGAQFAVLRDVDQRNTQVNQAEVQLRYDQSGEQQVQINTSVFRSDEELWSPGVDLSIPENESDSKYERQNVLASYRLNPAPAFFASVGAELISERGNSIGLLDFGAFSVPTEFDLKRNSSAFFIEGKYHLNRDAVWSVGFREDKAEGFEKKLSPQTGFQYRHGSGHYRLSWGKGFKLPSFFALGHPLVGNPDFRPETSEAVEFSAKYKVSPKFSYNAALFKNTYFDLIDFGDSGVLVSRDEVLINGIELGMDSSLSDKVFLKAHFLAIDMDIRNSSEVLHKRPERSAGVQLDWKVMSRLSAFMKVNYVGNVRDFSYPTGERKLDSYFRTDVTVNWGFTKGLQGSVAIDNVLDEKYEEAVGFKAPGALLRVAIQGSL